MNLCHIYDSTICTKNAIRYPNTVIEHNFDDAIPFGIKGTKTTADLERNIYLKLRLQMNRLALWLNNLVLDKSGSWLETNKDEKMVGSIGKEIHE